MHFCRVLRAFCGRAAPFRSRRERCSFQKPGGTIDRAHFKAPPHCGPVHDAGLLRRQEGSRSNFSALKRALQLLVDGSDDKPPDDIAYTYSGYAPLSVRLVEHAVKPGCSWAQVTSTRQSPHPAEITLGPSVFLKQLSLPAAALSGVGQVFTAACADLPAPAALQIEDTLKLLPGPHFETLQQDDETAAAQPPVRPGDLNLASS